MSDQTMLSYIDALVAHGFVILPDILPSDMLEEFERDLEPWFARTPPSQGHFHGWKTTRFGSVLAKSEIAVELVQHPTIRALADHVLNPNCDWYQLNLTQGVRIHPGAPAQPPHRDQEMWPVKIPGEMQLNILLALDEFTEENGATRIWPRSHVSQADFLSEDPGPSLAAEMPRGSAVAFLGSVLHGGGANRSSGHRSGFLFSYSLGWLKPYENQFLAYSLETVKRFPKAVRDLLGYRIHRPNLGGYEAQCPSVLLREEAPGPLPAVDALPERMEALAEQYAARQEQQS